MLDSNTRPPSSAPHHPRALVVDDEPLIRWCLAETLRGHLIDVDEAADAASALSAVRDSAAYDVILLDVRLPDADGLGLMRQLRQLLPRASIIVMSAHAHAALFERALGLGAFSVLAKPFPLAEVEGQVARALDGSRTARPALLPPP